MKFNRLLVCLLPFGLLISSCSSGSTNTTITPGSGNTTTTVPVLPVEKTPTWVTNSPSDVFEASKVQTACDIMRVDLSAQLDNKSEFKKLINELRSLENTYGLNAKEKANNQNLTYEEIWTGVSEIVRTYDDYPSAFRYPLSHGVTLEACTSFNFNSSNEEFSSRNITLK